MRQMESIMTKCMKCGVYIVDNTDKCPLCQQGVAPGELSSDNHQGTEGVFEQHNDVPDKCVNDTDCLLYTSRCV